MNGFNRIIKNAFSKPEANPTAPEYVSIYTKDILKNPRYIIGEYTYGNPTILDWNEGTMLSIGKFCSIADDVTILLGGNHRIDWVTTYPFSELNEDFSKGTEIKGHPQTKGDVRIGNDVWIGRGATIMSGTTIGDGAVIGASALVAKSVGPYEIVAGNPAQLIRERFDAKIVKHLLEIKWWNWPIEKINQELSFLCNHDINTFIERNTF